MIDFDSPIGGQPATSQVRGAQENDRQLGRTSLESKRKGDANEQELLQKTSPEPGGRDLFYYRMNWVLNAMRPEPNLRAPLLN